jgi:endonuclease-3
VAAKTRLTLADRAARIQRTLDRLYPEVSLPLDHEDPFTLLVAVVLSAKTTDKKVNQVTPGLFAVARTPEAMARLAIPEIWTLIREVGFAPQKARSLHGLSERLVREHGARVPATLEALLELPGVGRKTANVVLSAAFGVPAFPIDTHIHRLATRWGLSRGSSPEHTERDLRRIFPEDRWSRLHLQMFYFGREHCRARYHDFASCQICSWASTQNRMGREVRGSSASGRAARAGRLVSR